MGRKENTISILIPDGESYILLGVLRCLSSMKGLKIYVLSEKKYTSMKYSRYITEYIYNPYKNDVEAWLKLLNTLIEKYSIDVVMPMYEDCARQLIKSRSGLANPNLVLLPESLDFFEKAQNKLYLAEHLYKSNLPGPRFWSIEKLRSLDNLQSVKFPLLIKPSVVSGGGKGMIKFANEESLKSYLQDHPDLNEYVLQEFIEGFDVGCNVICKDGKILAHTIQKGTYFEKREFTPQIGLRMISDEKIFSIARDLMKSLNWTGVANIDMRYDSNTNEYKVLEINTRFWLTVLASAIAGVNFPWLYCQVVLGKDLPELRCQNINYYTHKGLIKHFIKNPKSILNLRGVWLRSPVKYQIQDPLMTTYHFFWALKNVLTGKQ